MKQKLILITGSPWVGKTTVGEALFRSYNNSAYFDGDWAWAVHPFSISDPRLRNGDKTISFALSVYLNSGFSYVICSSVVLLYEKIRGAVLQDITAEHFDVVSFTLICSEETLRRRFAQRGSEGEISFEWLHTPPHPGDVVIRTDGKTVEEIVDEMRRTIDGVV